MGKKTIYRLLVWMIAINIVLMTLAIYFYPEHFSFWSYPLSVVGQINSWPAGLVNTPSRYIFLVDMLVSALILLVIALRWRRQRPYHFIFWLMILASIGLFFTGVGPDDTLPLLHKSGVILGIGSIWIFIFILLGQEVVKRQTHRYWFLLMLTLIPIVVYAFLYIFYHATVWPFIGQKVALVCLSYALLRATYLYTL